jgi:clan AA aspartic protease (TIGR02281 family)
VLAVDAEVNGERLRLLVDSGATHVVLEPDAAARLGLLDAAGAARLRRKGAAPPAGIERRTLDRVEVGAHGFEDVPARILHTFEDGVLDGLLGLGAFGDRVWTLDYAAGRLYVED